MMKGLRLDVSHANDGVRYVTDSGAAVKWVLQRLRSKNVTYNGSMRWFVIIVMYILQVFWIGGDLSLNISHNIVVEDMLEVE